MKRLFLEISSGQGPAECELLVAKLMVCLTSELYRKVRFREVALNGNREKSLVKSVLFELEGEGAAVSVAPWLGTIQWIAASPFRSHHKRRNWYAGIRLFEAEPELAFDPNDVEFSASRSSGPGGQHVNTSNTRIQAFHRPTGLCAVAGEERSQLRNRELALARLAAKVAARGSAGSARLGLEAWQAHRELERGNPVRVFRGDEL
ncbi:peptide chain release factor H [Victivallis vadensis]|uniref:peptide chain release factor H n=1 Tax=Victivallis vadensis TaxID=172901 RepID=UPI0023F579AF|nr:peptide chain release factor H [Victivallis vadensis]